MLRATASIDAPAFAINAMVNGLAVYLDNWAIIDLAKGDPGRRTRFIAAFHSGADLLFSVSNAVDLTGPQGASLEAVRMFLNEIGPHWIPVELDATEVVKREQSGATPSESCLSRNFLKDYFNVRIADYLPKSGKVMDLFDGLFSLGAFLDWVGPQRDSIRQSTGDLDSALIDKVAGYRAKYEVDNRWLDERFPAMPYSVSRPATSAYLNLIRGLIVENKSHTLVKSDGLDFCYTMTGWLLLFLAVPLAIGGYSHFLSPGSDNVLRMAPGELSDCSAAVGP
jgi:hypothetical protein